MSIFGKLDAETIPSNPFFIEKGEYSAEVTKALIKSNRDGDRQLVIEYTINDEDSQYLDSKATQYLTLVDENMDAAALALLPADEQKKIRQTNAKIKRTLCGNPGNSSQKGLGVDTNDLNSGEWNPETLVGIKVRLAISNYGTDGVNVQWVNISD